MRLGRRYPFQPALPGPVVISAMALPLEHQRTVNVVRPDRLRERDPRATHSFLRPPQPAAAPVTVDQQRLRVVLAETPPQPRPLASKLSPPVEAAAPPVETVIRVVRAVRATFDRRKAQQPVLGAPVVIDEAAVADAPVVTGLRSVFARRVPQRELASKLSPPAVVDQPPLVTKLLSSLAESPRFRQLGTKVRPPATLETFPPVETTIRVVKAVRATFDRRKAMQPVLGAPVVIDPAVEADAPVVTRLLSVFAPRVPQRARDLSSKLFPPATLETFPPVETTIRVVKAVRARFDRREAMQPVLGAPVVVDPAVEATDPVVTDLRVVFPVRTQRQRHATKYELQPPAVVSTGSAPVVVGVLTTLAAIQTRAQYRKRPTKYELRPPTVVNEGPVVTDILTTLAALQTIVQRQKRDLPNSLLSPPAVIGPPLQPPVETVLRVVFPVRLQPDRYGTKYGLLPPTVIRPGPICPDLVPADPASISLVGATDGTLTLSAASQGTLTLAPPSDGSLTFGAADPGSLTLIPAEDCHDD
jgi:hypothetical protein